VLEVVDSCMVFQAAARGPESRVMEFARLRSAAVSPDRSAGVPRCPEVSRDRRFTAFAASYRKQYTDPSREPTTTSPVGPMAGDEATGPSVAKDHTSVPSGDTA